jgi:hypothetical protein
MRPDELGQLDDRVKAAEAVLRHLTKVAPPEGLEERMHRRLQASRLENGARNGIAWGFGGMRVRFALAAVLLAVLAGGGWEAYRVRLAGGTKEARQVPVAPTLPAVGADSGFSAAKGMRVPPTLTPLRVPAVPKKKVAGKAKKAVPVAAARASSPVAGPAQP